MFSIRYAAIVSTLTCAVVACICNTHASTPEAEAVPGWTQLAGLVGTWKLEQPSNTAQEKFRISYRFISRDTALVETFGDPSGNVTETVYHPDGDRIVATHYCSQGNQPRSRLLPVEADSILRFEFIDATNLHSESDSHLVRMAFTMGDGNRLVRTEDYAQGGEVESSSLTLVRER